MPASEGNHLIDAGDTNARRNLVRRLLIERSYETIEAIRAALVLEGCTVATSTVRNDLAAIGADRFENENGVLAWGFHSTMPVADIRTGETVMTELMRAVRTGAITIKVIGSNVLFESTVGLARNLSYFLTIAEIPEVAAVTEGLGHVVAWSYTHETAKWVRGVVTGVEEGSPVNENMVNASTVDVSGINNHLEVWGEYCVMHNLQAIREGLPLPYPEYKDETHAAMKDMSDREDGVVVK